MNPVFRQWLRQQKRIQHVQADARRQELRRYGLDNFTIDQQDPFGFLISQTSHIETQVQEVRYVDIRYPRLAFVDTSANSWARSITYFSRDMIGPQAAWFSGEGTHMPHAETFKSKHEVTIEMAAMGYGYNIEELNQATMVPGTNLSSDRAMAANRFMEEFLDNIFLNGDADRGWDGLINQPATSVTRTNAPAGTAGDEEWSTKTADEVLADINAVLQGIFAGTNTIELADTVLLPPGAWAQITSQRIPDTTMTVLQWIRNSNVYTASTGQPLTIMQLVGLENAGAANVGRMVAYRNMPDVLRFHLPMPHTFLPVWQVGPMQFEVPGIVRCGGLEIRRPSAMRYMDMITT